MIDTCETKNEGYPPPKRWNPLTISIDPGISTGLVVISTEGEVVVHDTLKVNPDELSQVLYEVREKHKAAIVIIERLPSTLSRAMQEVVVSVHSVFPETPPMRSRYTKVAISPGEWKPMTNKLPVPFVTYSQHEKDAFRMAACWMMKKGFWARQV